MLKCNSVNLTFNLTHKACNATNSTSKIWIRKVLNYFILNKLFGKTINFFIPVSGIFMIAQSLTF